MKLFSALKGDTYHFNKNAIPVWNEIDTKLTNAIEKLDSGTFITKKDKKEIFSKILGMTQICVFDMLFHPNTGVIKKRVKSFDQEAFYTLYETIIFFLILTFKNIQSLKADELKKVFIDAIGRTDECNTLWVEMDNSYKDINKLIRIILQKISNFTGKLDNKEEPSLTSAFRGLGLTFIGTI